MKWNEHLDEQSQKWAVTLAENDSGLQHSEPLDGLGVNLYISKGQAAATGAHQAVLQWYKTITHYNFNIRKFNLRSGTFTQLVWDDTIKLEVGVAFREDTQNTCIVAQYVLPGNGPGRIPKLEELVPPSNNEEENKPVESWSGALSSNQENAVQEKTSPLKSSQGIIDGSDKTITIERKSENNEATKNEK